MTVLPSWRRTMAILLKTSAATLGAVRLGANSASASGGRPSAVFAAVMLGALVDLAAAYGDRPSTSEKGCKFMTPFHPVGGVRTQPQTGFLPYEVRPQYGRGRREERKRKRKK